MTDMMAGYGEFCEFLEIHSGICLGANKQYLVSSRLRQLMAEHSVTTLKALVDKANARSQTALKTQVIDAMTTNETLWFRDTHPFRILKDVILPELYSRKGNSPLRIWSSACSTGQEPYSISMVLQDYREAQRVYNPAERIIATDISPSALAQAKSGEYASLAIGRGLDTQRLKKHFTETANGRFKINRELAKNIEFRPLNLKDGYNRLGKFDIVFCRNVLIYFTTEFKKDILTRIHATLNPGGYLVVGASESVSGLSDLYEMVHCRPGIIYKKK